MCKSNFESAFSLEIHVENVHIKQNSEKYECKVCFKQFENSTDLKIQIFDSRGFH